MMVSASATNVDLPDVVPGRQVVPPGARRMTTPRPAGLVKYLTTKLKPDDDRDRPRQQRVREGPGRRPARRPAGRPTSRSWPPRPSTRRARTTRAAVNTVKAADPDAVFFGGYYEAAGRLKKQLTDAGVDAPRSSAADGALDAGFIEAAGDAAEGALLSCPCYFASEASPGQARRVRHGLRGASSATRPGTYSTEAYDAANILLDRHRRRATPTGPSLLDVRRGPDDGRLRDLEGGRVRRRTATSRPRASSSSRSRTGDRPRDATDDLVGPTSTRSATGGRPQGALLRTSTGSHAIEFNLSALVDQFWAQTVDGLTLGSIYALIALGYTLVYGVLRLINFAHSEIFAIGIFATVFAIDGMGITGDPARAQPGAHAARRCS